MPHPQATAERKRRGSEGDGDMKAKYLQDNKCEIGMIR
jgi:hypothetical protein